MNDAKLGVEIRDETKKGADSAKRNIKGIGSEAKRTEQETRKLNRTMGHLKTGLLSLGAAVSVREIARYADTWTTVENRLKLATRTTAEFNKVQARHFDTAKGTRAPLQATAELYQRLERSSRTLGLSQSDLIGLTRTINQTLLISGASGEGANAALVQLGQAFASGVLRGEELNSVLEQAPRLAQVFADGLEVPIGNLRELGAAGELSVDKLVRALKGEARVVNAEVGEISQTIGQGLTTVDNSVIRLVGSLDKLTGASSGIGKVLVGVSDGLDAISSSFSKAESFFHAIDKFTGQANTIQNLLKISGRTVLSALPGGQSALLLNDLLSQSGGTSKPKGGTPFAAPPIDFSAFAPGSGVLQDPKVVEARIKEAGSELKKVIEGLGFTFAEEVKKELPIALAGTGGGFGLLGNRQFLSQSNDDSQVRLARALGFGNAQFQSELGEDPRTGSRVSGTFSRAGATPSVKVATALAEKRERIRLSEIKNEQVLQQEILKANQAKERQVAISAGATTAQLTELEKLFEAEQRALEPQKEVTTGIEKFSIGLDLAGRSLGGLNPVLDDFISTATRAITSGNPLQAAAEGVGFLVRRITGQKDENERLIDSIERVNRSASRTADTLERLASNIDNNTEREVARQKRLVDILNAVGPGLAFGVAQGKFFQDTERPRLEEGLRKEGFEGGIQGFFNELVANFPGLDLTDLGSVKGVAELADELTFAAKNFGEINTKTFAGAREEFGFQRSIQNPETAGELREILKTSFGSIAEFDFSSLDFTLKDGVELTQRQTRDLELLLNETVRFREVSEDFFSTSLKRQNSLEFGAAAAKIRAQFSTRFTGDDVNDRKVFVDLTKQIKALADTERAFEASGITLSGASGGGTVPGAAAKPGDITTTGPLNEIDVTPESVVHVGNPRELSPLDFITLPEAGAFEDLYKSDLLPILDTGLLGVLFQNQTNIRRDQSERVEYTAADFITLPKFSSFRDLYRDTLAGAMAGGRVFGLWPRLEQARDNIRRDQENRVKYVASDFVTLPGFDSFRDLYRNDLAGAMTGGRIFGLWPRLEQARANIRRDQENRFKYTASDFITLPGFNSFRDLYRNELAGAMAGGRVFGLWPRLEQARANIRRDQENRVKYTAADFVTLPDFGSFRDLYRDTLAVSMQGGRIFGLWPRLSQARENIRRDQESRVKYTASDFITLPDFGSFRDLYRDNLAVAMQGGRIFGLWPRLSQARENIRHDQQARIKYTASDFVTLPGFDSFRDLYRNNLAGAMAGGRVFGLWPRLSQARENIREDQKNRFKYEAKDFITLPEAVSFRDLYRGEFAVEMGKARIDGLLPALKQNRLNIRDDQKLQVKYEASDLISFPRAIDFIFEVQESLNGLRTGLEALEGVNIERSSLIKLTGDKLDIKKHDVINTNSEAVRIAEGRELAPWTISPSEAFRFSGPRLNIRTFDVIDPGSTAVQRALGNRSPFLTIDPDDIFRLGSRRIRVEITDVFDFGGSLNRLIDERVLAITDPYGSNGLSNRGF